MCPDTSIPFDLMGAFEAADHPTASQSPAQVVHEIIDQQHGGLVAAVYTHPAGWQAQSQVVWDMQKYNLPLRVFSRVSDPLTGDTVEFFPVEGFYWIEPNWGFGKAGQETAGTVLMPQMSAGDALVRWVIPRYRGQGVTNLRVLKVQPLDPRRLRMPGSPIPQGAAQEGVSVLIEFTANGRQFEEEFCGLKTAQMGIPTYGAAGVLTQYNWYFERLFSFCTQKGRLDSFRGIGWNIVHSVRTNPQWVQLCGTIQQQIAQMFNQYLQAGYDQIAAAGQVSRQISANADAWLAQQQHSREAANHADQIRRQQANSGGSYSTADAFSDAIMGRDSYEDPYYVNGSQHGYHDEVWTDGQGNYAYRDSGGADPNVGSDRSWTLMQKRTVNG